MMRRYVIPILVLFVLLGAGLYVLLNKPWVLSYVMPRIIEPYFKEQGIELKSFRFARQIYKAPATIVLTDVHMLLEKDDEEYSFDIQQMVLEDILYFQKSKDQLRIFLEGLKTRGSWGSLQEASVKLILSSPPAAVRRIDGLIKGKFLESHGYLIENFYARFKGTFKQLQIFEITASAYGGNLIGQISLEKKEELTYVVWLEFFQVAADQLAKIEKYFMPELSGHLNGTFRLIGDPKRIELLDVNFSMPEGATIKPKLMIKVMERMVDFEKKDRLEALLSKEDQFKADEASFNIRNLSENKLAVFLTLVNKKKNLTVKETLEYTLEDNLRNLLWQPQGPVK